MRKNLLKSRLAAGEAALNAWLCIPSALIAEAATQGGFDAVTIDMQHGMLDYAQAISMLQAISIGPATPLARPISSDPVQIMRLLDAGAYGVICPQVDTPEIAAACVAACRYPPAGARSMGSPRGMLYGGPDYMEKANDEILVFVMIESRQAVENLDAILDVKGIDGVFIGPNDLALSYGMKASSDPQGEVGEIIQKIRAASAARNLASGIYCVDGDMCKKRIDQGFQLVNPGADLMMLQGAFQAHLQAARR